MSRSFSESRLDCTEFPTPGIGWEKSGTAALFLLQRPVDQVKQECTTLQIRNLPYIIMFTSRTIVNIKNKRFPN